MKILFVCTANKLRSPTAAKVFAEWPGLETCSAGLDPACPQPVNEELLAWADRVFVMEPHHRKTVRRQFRAALGDKPLIVIGIPDEYKFMDPALIAHLENRVPEFLD